MDGLPDWCIFFVICVPMAICVLMYGIQCIRYANNTIKKCKYIQNEWRKTDFHVGDVVQTQSGHDRGLVTKIDENNMPIEVIDAPGLNRLGDDYTSTRYYGGARYVTWYKTGEHMTITEWNKLYSKKEGWERYCEDRANQIKINN